MEFHARRWKLPLLVLRILIVSQLKAVCRRIHADLGLANVLQAMGDLEQEKELFNFAIENYEDAAILYKKVMDEVGLAEIDIPSAYDHFAEGESPEPPFITYLMPRTNNFSADGRVYLRVTEVHIELYTDEKNPEVEAQVEAVLDVHEIFYDKTEVWIETEKLYEVLYSFEMED